MEQRFPFLHSLQDISLERGKSRSFLIFLALSFLFWTITKFSNQYTEVLTFDVAFENFPLGVVPISSNTSEVQMTLSASGFQFLFYKFFVNEIVREKILTYYKKEIPYSVEILTEEFFEEEKIIRIRSVIMVERESQKGIVIGHKGVALKRVGTSSRRDLEAFFGKQIHIELYVKVNKNWRSNQNQLRRFGYNN